MLYVYVEPTTVKDDDNIYLETTFIVYMYSFLVISLLNISFRNMKAC